MGESNHQQYRLKNNTPAGDGRSPLWPPSSPDERIKIRNNRKTNISDRRNATLIRESNSDKGNKGEISRRRQRSRSRDRCVAAQSSLLRRRAEGGDSTNNPSEKSSQNHEKKQHNCRGDLPGAQAARKNDYYDDDDGDEDDDGLRRKRSVRVSGEQSPALKEEESPIMEFYFRGAVAGEERSERDYSHWLGFLSTRNGGCRYLQDGANLLKVMDASVYDD